MFELVLDVESYPDFLPHCTSVELIQAGDRQLDARMTLQRLGVRCRLTTRSRFVRPLAARPGSIGLELLQGPLRRLQGEWRFSPLPEAGSAVELDLMFELQGGLPGRLLGGLLGPLTAQMVEVFCRRADQLYAD